MSGLVAVATTVLHLSGRVALALLLTVFLLAYGALGLLLTPVVGFVLAAIALPRQLRALARLGEHLGRDMLAKRKLTRAARPWTMPPT